MRLTCPDCGAEYDIDDALIPAAGREVECAACGHHWHQSGRSHHPFLLGDPSLSPEVRPEARAEARPEVMPPVPPPARPPAPRPSPTVLDILREEAARELAQRGEALPAAAPPAARWDRSGAARHQDAPGDPLATAAPPSPEAAASAKAPTYVAPTLGFPARAAPEPAAAGPQSGAFAPKAPATEAPAFAARPPSVPASAAFAAQSLASQVSASSGPSSAPPETIVAELVADDDLPSARSSLPLPDAHAWAASLQWSPAPIAAPAAVRRRDGRSAHDAGFALAAGLAALLLATYIAAPHVTGRPGAALMELRHDIDRGRLRLHQHAVPVVDGALARIGGWPD